MRSSLLEVAWSTAVPVVVAYPLAIGPGLSLTNQVVPFVGALQSGDPSGITPEAMLRANIEWAAAAHALLAASNPWPSIALALLTLGIQRLVARVTRAPG